METNLIINIDENKTINMTERLLQTKVKYLLSTLGFNERYTPFEYLEELIILMIKNNDDSLVGYKENLKNLEEKHAVSNKTIIAGLGKILKTCNEPIVKDKAQFNLIKNSTINKIRVIKNYILNSLV